MRTRFWMSLVLSLLAVAGCIYATLVPQTILPFDMRPGARIGLGVVVPSSVGLTMPAGLQPGDVVDMSAMDLHDRVLFITSGGNPMEGETINLPVRRDGKNFRVPVSVQLDHKTGMNLLVYLAQLALTWLFAALGLLLLWRGQRQAAWAVCSWCLLNVLLDVGTSIYAPLPYTSYAATLSSYLLNVGTLIALYLLADDLTRAGVASGTRRALLWLFLGLFVAYALFVPYLSYSAMFHGVVSNYFRALIVVHLGAFAVPLTLLALFYRHAEMADRPRIRWVGVSIFVYVVSYLVSTNILSLLAFISPLQVQLAVVALTAVAFLGFTYAVLRHRLVSLRLVLNRALVYGVITTLVVGVFAALSSLIDHFAVGRTEGALLQLLVPLSLGVTLNLVKKRLDRFVERLFFQRQFRAEGALSRLARECGFIENRDVLLDRSADEILEYLKPTGVALYEKSAAGYARVRNRGTRLFPEQLVADDPAMVSLRANLVEADLDTLKSGLGNEGLAFPLAVRGTLMGALVLGQRPAEQYTQSERALLTRIAQQLAAALHALRAREAESFVDAVARGELAADAATRSRARQLVSQQAQAA
ncbi:MAG TPA: GAF domain-containing protein [Gammaproteobacteria bacterium]|nr:GAF domain-containing protein [Gammaproteobacteria bacterium]